MRKFVFLVSLFMVFAAASCLAAEMGQIGIFTEAVSWTDVGTANAVAQKIIADLKLTRDIEILGDKAIGDFAEANTGDGDLDIIITFGYFPVSLYTPGNGERDDSVAELFLEDGNMFINTADWIFYVTQGGGANGAAGLQNITDSTFDMGADGNRNEPTDDGKKYTPSLPDSYEAVRVFKTGQVEANDEWEVEVVFGENGPLADPAVIHNLEYDGRVAIVFQIGGVQPRAEVIIEMLDNWLSTIVKPDPVELLDKLSVTWAEVKHGL